MELNVEQSMERLLKNFKKADKIEQEEKKKKEGIVKPRNGIKK